MLSIVVRALLRPPRQAMASSTPAPRSPLLVKKRRLPMLTLPLAPAVITGSAPSGYGLDTGSSGALDWARKSERRVPRVYSRLYTLQPEADAHYL